MLFRDDNGVSVCVVCVYRNSNGEYAGFASHPGEALGAVRDKQSL